MQQEWGGWRWGGGRPEFWDRPRNVCTLVFRLLSGLQGETWRGGEGRPGTRGAQAPGEDALTPRTAKWERAGFITLADLSAPAGKGPEELPFSQQPTEVGPQRTTPFS